MGSFFTKHLRDVNETYFVHLKHAMYFSAHMMRASAGLAVHAFVPFIFVTLGSKTITKLYNLMSTRVKIANRHKRKKIAIIGLGASGIMVLHNIVQKNENLEVDIFDKDFHSLGVAYNTMNAEHLLNIRAENMSAVAEDKEHFVQWLEKNGWNFTKSDFVPRPIYGLYLKDLLREAILLAERKRIKVKFYNENIENIGKGLDYFVINGDIYYKCYLCIGVEFLNKDRNFWCKNQNEIMHSIQNEKEIHIVGTGLSAFDAICSITLSGFNGTIILHSRTGTLTMPHKYYNASEKPNIRIEDFDIHNFIKLCKESHNPYSIIDAIRNITPQIWQSLSLQKRKSIMRHLFKHWNKYRHRAPEIQYQKIVDMIASGRIQTTTTKPPQNAIYCTGFDWKNVSPLEKSLIDNQIAIQDELQMGIVSVADNFHIIGGKNFGSLFETTAIPELRNQALS